MFYLNNKKPHSYIYRNNWKKKTLKTYPISLPPKKIKFAFILFQRIYPKFSIWLILFPPELNNILFLLTMGNWLKFPCKKEKILSTRGYKDNGDERRSLISIPIWKGGGKKEKEESITRQRQLSTGVQSVRPLWRWDRVESNSRNEASNSKEICIEGAIARCLGYFAFNLLWRLFGHLFGRYVRTRTAFLLHGIVEHGRL